MPDNLGHIVSAEYILADNVRSCAITKVGILISLSAGKDWIKFPAGIGKIEISVVESESNGSSTFTTAGSITCPRSKYKSYADMFTLKNARVLIRYRTASGDLLVVGDKENPIKITTDRQNPTTASGFSGAKFNLSGVMNHSELPLL